LGFEDVEPVALPMMMTLLLLLLLLLVLLVLLLLEILQQRAQWRHPSRGSLH
jgi:hypothetical protein